MGNKEKRRHKSRSISRERRKDVSHHGKKSHRYDVTDKTRVNTRYGLGRIMSLVFATRINIYSLNPLIVTSYCLRVRYRTPRLRGYESGTGPLDTEECLGGPVVC